MGAKISPVLIVGSKNTGKTTFLEQLIQRARKLDLVIGGFLSRGKVSITGGKEYFLEDIRTGQQYLLAAETPAPSRIITYGKYYFDPTIFQMGNDLLLKNLHAHLLVLDEFGPLELSGQGFRNAFNEILVSFRGIFLIAVRPSLLSATMTILKTQGAGQFPNDPRKK